MDGHDDAVDEPVLTEQPLDMGALRDLIAILVTLVVIKQSLLPVIPFYAGSLSLLAAMILGTGLLWRRGLGWKALGLRWPQSWWKTGLLTVLTLAVMIGTMGLVGWIVDLYFEDVGSSGRFDYIEGNLLGYLGVMALVWTQAAFFEELIFRAFIINRAGTFLGGGFSAYLVAAIFSGAFFGYRHGYYQGINGALTIAAVGFVMALLYLWFGRRNIVPLVLAHGLIDSLGITFRFLNTQSD